MTHVYLRHSYQLTIEFCNYMYKPRTKNLDMFHKCEWSWSRLFSDALICLLDAICVCGHIHI